MRMARERIRMLVRQVEGDSQRNRNQQHHHRSGDALHELVLNQRQAEEDQQAYHSDERHLGIG